MLGSHIYFSLSVELVFHGTRCRNIEAIQRDGLNPKLRSRQAFGVGEYFNRQPKLSLSYCRGGGTMFVFAVIVPDVSHYREA